MAIISTVRRVDIRRRVVRVCMSMCLEKESTTRNEIEFFERVLLLLLVFKEKDNLIGKRRTLCATVTWRRTTSWVRACVCVPIEVKEANEFKSHHLAVLFF